ncbi:MAG: cytochrome c [Burkholderiaceae bacterium]|jgi:cytochrome c553|nr:cytochrome c [Burkholderiaceae bacterium]MCU0928985.1 cytochrome c [Burkholderiaceae bacterium]
MKRFLALLLAAGASGMGHAADLEAGRVRAQQACAVCHGPLGIAAAPDAPNLAGQPAFYVASQLRAYRNGSRKHEVMAVISKTLSDDEINNLAAWFASIRIEAHAPR